jgi:hypothetical protein
MRRRDLLKALATVPFTAAIGGCDDRDKDDKKKDKDEKKKDEKHAKTLEIHLDGAFALVIQKNKGNSLLAFSPRPVAPEVQHQFYFNGYRRPEGGTAPLTFTMKPEGLARERHEPEINPGLNDFFFQSANWRVGDTLIRMELPPPDRITFAGHRSPVTFANGRAAWMPTNHVLKYELRGDAPMLECSDTKLKCAPSPDSYPGVTRFFFEIGPAADLNFAQSHAHAVHFFNYILQQCFPDLAKTYSLQEPDSKRPTVNPRLAPAVFQYDAPFARFQEASYITDCEYAGPLVGTSTGPTG